MIYLQLLWTFFKIGLFTIGGGHAMIPLIMNDVVERSWLTQEQVLDFIAISEGTPGPFAINIATFTGMEVAGIGGAALATLGVVLPSLIIIMIIAKLFSKHMQKPVVQEVFINIRGTITGLISSVAVTIGLTVILGITSVWDKATAPPDFIGIVMFVVLLALSFVRYKNKRMHPIVLILLSGALGVLCYGFIPI